MPIQPRPRLNAELIPVGTAKSPTKPLKVKLQNRLLVSLLPRPVPRSPLAADCGRVAGSATPLRRSWR